MTQGHRATDGDNVIIRHNRIEQGALVSIALFLLIQTFGWIWWASSTSTTLGFLKEEVRTVKETVNKDSSNSYRATDAVKDFSYRDARIAELSVKVEQLFSKKGHSAT